MAEKQVTVETKGGEANGGGLYALLGYPLYRFPYGGAVLKALRGLLRSQWATPAELEALRVAKLRRVVRHAVEHVPAFRMLEKKQGEARFDIGSCSDLSRLPLTGKADLRDHASEFRSERLRRISHRVGSTGGSTGEPLRFLKDRESDIWSEAAWLRGRLWAGVHIGDKGVVVGATRVSALGYLRQLLVNLHPMVAFGDAKLFEENVRKLARIRPKAVNSFSSVLVELAEAARRTGRTDARIPIIFNTGEKLFEHQRELVRDVFGSEIRDCYGSNEVGGVAYECEMGRLHVSSEHVIVEVLNERGQAVTDEVGRIVITDLDNLSMPFLRYEIGDMGSVSSRKCACGRVLEVLESIDGRVQECLVDSVGRRVSAIVFPCRFKDLRHVERYQIVQETRRHVVLRFVPIGQNYHDEVERMKRVLEEVLGTGIDVEVRREAQIERTPHGKTRYVVTAAG